MKQRKYKRVDVISLDISSSGMIAKDGNCQEIMNMRKADRHWSNVCQAQSLTSSSVKHEILYHHKAAGEDCYIIKDGRQIVHAKIDLHSGEVTIVAQLFMANNVDEIKIFSFGTVLYITEGENESVFVYYNQNYTLFEIDKIEPIENAQIGTTYLVADGSDLENSYDRPLVAQVECDQNGAVTSFTRHDNYHHGLLRSQGYVTGTSYMMIGYRLWDGSIVKCSRLYMLQNEHENDKSPHGLIRTKSENTYRYFTSIKGGKFTVSFVLPDLVVESPLVTSVVLLATRPCDTYDFENIHTQFDTSQATSLNDGAVMITSRASLITQEAKSAPYSPYYIIKEVDTIAENKYSDIALEYNEHFENIHFGTTYTPNFSIHSQKAKHHLDYNNRLHMADITQKLYKGSPHLHTSYTYGDGSVYRGVRDNNITIFCSVKILIDGQTKLVKSSETQPIIYTKDQSEGKYIVVPNILSYHDSRATELTISYYDMRTGVSATIKSYKLNSAPEVNISWYADHSQGSLLYHHALLLPTAASSTPQTVDDVVIDHDKIVVSENGNPFSFLPAHTYYIGQGIKIYRLTSSSQQLTESRFGQHPVVVFTSEGIFSLERGAGDILYSQIVPISNDIIDQDSDIIAVEPFIFYCNARSVMMQIGSRVEQLSGPIEVSPSQNSHPPLSQYIKGAFLLYSSIYGELHLCNNNYEHSYCYQINEKVWSMRQINGKKVSDSQYSQKGVIFDLNKEEDITKPLACSLLTMAIKLDHYSYKHLDAMLLATESSLGTLWEVEVEGSNNLVQWQSIKRSVMDSSLRRFTSSWLYLRIGVEVKGYAQEGNSGTRFSISAFDFEYYTRFDRHLRN